MLHTRSYGPAEIKAELRLRFGAAFTAHPEEITYSSVPIGPISTALPLFEIIGGRAVLKAIAGYKY
jgi:hypothetical protein